MATYPRKGMQRILAGSYNPELRAQLRNQDGEPSPATGTPTVTCTITRADGTTVGSAGRSAAIGSAGQLTASLTTAEASTLDVLSVAWSVDGVVRTTSHHRVVGGFLFAISEVTALGGLGTYDNVTLLQFRDATIDMVEKWTGVSWNPAYDLEQFQGFNRCTHASTFRPLRTVRSLSLDGSAQGVSDLKVNPESGLITSLSALCGWTIIGVEHGFDEPPDDLRNAGIQACKFALLQSKSALGQRVRSISDEQGTRTFSFAGKNHPTGIDDIDSVIMSYDMRDPY